MANLQLYLADVRELEQQEALALTLLTPRRRARAEAIRIQRDRLHCIGAGLLLRRVLKVEHDDQLQEDEYGKLTLAGGPHFNLSHGGNYAVLAVFRAPVGVDVEPVGERVPAIPRRFLRPDELVWLESDPNPERFTRLWTRLESALKADGRGLAMDGRDFSVLNSGEPWFIETIHLESHFISCAAGETFDLQLDQLSAEELLRW